ncbi:ATP synthase F1 subunit gamma [Halanaerobacter jeridensis]|uniref:ATP synthase gamma chain n=1 Tax=Halanaerobacter jeridensis TaxID=706427 RepID=A0A938XSI2_9FIRM|nr:ATP synthase F1 subunit gamma [Halanaerobacter jeridensis]MBM7557009.1 F-type H+-transporting ATPase subunit gamma [Halanaerobacter jeridensis]
MQSMRDIKRQISSVENTKKITRAMKMVASAKLQKAQERAENAKPFFTKTKQTLAGITGGDTQDSHPLMEEREVEKVGYVVVTGDRGLCGPYNNKVIKKVEELTAARDEDVALFAVGNQGQRHFKRNGYEIISEYLDVPDKPGFVVAENIAIEIMELYREEMLDEVNIVYTDFESVLSHKVEVIELFPIEPPEQKEDAENMSKYLYEPSAGAVLNSVLPQYVTNLIFGSLLQAKASEFASRMTAMDSATENAEEMIDDLTLSYNRARQAAITQELTEIVGGAEALE